MKKTITTLFLVFALAITFQNVDTIADTDQDSEKEVSKLEQKYFEALENQDQELMASLLADEFVISSMSSNWSMSRQDFLATIPKQVIKSQTISDIKVEVKGEKANSQVDITMIKTYKGDDHSGDYEVYSVWVNAGGSGNWKLLERKIKFLNPPE